MPGSSVRMAWICVAVSLAAVWWGCTVPAPEAEQSIAPLHTLEAVPEWPPAFPPRNLYVVYRTEAALTVVWSASSRATYYDVQRSSSAEGEYAVVATEVAALGFVDEGLQPDRVYYYAVRACNHLGCTEFDNEPVAGVTESDADVDVPSIPKDVGYVRKLVDVFPDVDKVTWTVVEGATYYEVYRAGDRLTAVSAPLTTSSHTDLGRSLERTLSQSYAPNYQVRACNKAGCSPLE